MANEPPPTTDGFRTAMRSGRAKPGSASVSTLPVEQISLDEVMAIFRPGSPPMAAVKLVWDNPDRLDLPAMRLRLRKIARDLQAKPLNEAVDAMMQALDNALLQLETAPAGLTLSQAMALKNAAIHLRTMLEDARSRA